jgi:uncharacterized protein (TIGR00251 family)
VPDDSPELDLRSAADGVTLRVRLKPRASRDGLDGVREGALVIRLTAPPVEGEANAALIRFVARLLDRPPSAVTLVHGAKSRDKTLHVAGIDAARARALVERA